MSLFQQWVKAFRKTQRPIWVDTQIENCFICEKQFSYLNRQHHCRKCGTAICKNCSKVKIPLPELAYNNPVRICINCKEGI